MKKILLSAAILIFSICTKVYSQNQADTSVYLITCGPGIETYSVYGHSALRVVLARQNSDIVYNWGVFDFETPNFAWKFAKGRLDYMLNNEPLQQFLSIYIYEKRFVLSQKLNIEASEKYKLLSLINDNLKPENKKYRYDFFYDDCSTRIRDLLEKSVGEKMLYPPAEKRNFPTYRSMVGKYQNPFPWLKFGVDLIMGSTAEKRATFRDEMFLPLDMKNGLSATVVNRNGKMIPLLQNPEIILDFDPPVVKQNFFITPVFIFTLILIFIIILSSWVKTQKSNNRIDIAIYSVYSILAVLMIFFNFFTDHQQMKWNLNILWLNPFIPVCLFLLIFKKTGMIFFRIVFIITTAFFLIHFILPQAFNTAILPLVLILIVRSSVRAGFDWNPLSIK